ncbi:MAG: TolB family protein, partial [Myxococcales bacterium]
MIRSAAAAALLALAACTTVRPIFEQDVQASFATQPMRRLETRSLELYYPAHRKEQALRFAADLEACVAQLDANLVDEPRKLLFYLTESRFNNAYVMPMVGGIEQHAVVPTSDSLQWFYDVGGSPGPRLTGCHEAVHAVVMAQNNGFSYGLNLLLGSVFSPQIGHDTWFHEGLATYYESKLVPGTGRMASPHWGGLFEAAVAEDGFGPSDLHRQMRTFGGSNPYLYGSHFVRWLAETHGERKLWELVDVQSRALTGPFGWNVRFWQVYDKSLSTLVDEYAAHVKKTYRSRARPAEQRMRGTVGADARHAVGRDGTSALVFADFDEPLTLEVFAPDGSSRLRRELTEVLPPRTINAQAFAYIAGLTVADDGASVWFVTHDWDEVYLRPRLVRVDVQSGALEMVLADLDGYAAAPSPDGRSLFAVGVDGDRHLLVHIDRTTVKRTELFRPPPGHFVGPPQPSPDGTSLAVPLSDGTTWSLWLFDADGTQR